MAEKQMNRRRYPRVRIGIPARVKGQAGQGHPWEEIGTSEDASLGGLSLRLTKPVEWGQLLSLTLPMPPQLRLYDDNDPTYFTYAVVRNVMAFPRHQCVRVRFLGKRPPRQQAPGATVRGLASEAPDGRQHERRVAPRYDVFLNLQLGRRAENGGQSERTVTENLSADGARVPTTLTVEPGEVVTVSELDGDFRTEAVARGLYTGRDHIRRINLHFLNRVPRRLIDTAQL
jgi:hypothetical protein